MCGHILTHLHVSQHVVLLHKTSPISKTSSLIWHYSDSRYNTFLSKESPAKLTATTVIPLKSMELHQGERLAASYLLCAKSCICVSSFVLETQFYKLSLQNRSIFVLSSSHAIETQQKVHFHPPVPFSPYKWMDTAFSDLQTYRGVQRQCRF